MTLDVTGREVKPGDFILYLSKGWKYKAGLSPAMVIKINQKSIRSIIATSEYSYPNGYIVTSSDVVRIENNPENLFVVDDIPSVKGFFRSQVIEIIKHCLENETLSDEIRERCIFQMGCLAL